MTKLTAVMAGGGTQDTIYTYGTTKGASLGDSKISTGKLLKSIQYRDSGAGSDVVTYAYNAQGELICIKDQSGNVVEHIIDTAGRVTEQQVTTVDADFDDTVRRIETSFHSPGELELVTQHDHPTNDSIIDQVREPRRD